MYISKETKEVTDIRLQQVIIKSEFKILEGVYHFIEKPVDNFYFEPDAVAVIRDDDVWSFLVPGESNIGENFKIFRFHFEDNLDNSGFVGWLATKIKEELGSGVFVICGQNTKKGGIFDYWGCPAEISDDLVRLIHKLRG